MSMTARHRGGLALAAALLLAATRADAQERRETVLPERIAPAARAAIERLGDSLRSERLPAFALNDKAAEGVLKGADDARILVAVRALAQRLRDARLALGAQARDNELLAGASAIYAGVTPDAVARFAATQRKRNASASLTVPLTVIAELASNRVPTDVALSSVDSLMARGARDTDFGSFRLSVERDLRQGLAPRDAVAAGMRMTLRGIERPPE